MKVRDSGMPDENYWNSFFDTRRILQELEIDSQIKDAAEIGTGYGTFTLPAAEQISGVLYGFDIEAEMIALLKKKTSLTQINNVIPECRDVLTATTGLPDHSVDYVMLFNILHNELPETFLEESHRILRKGGKTGIIHWRSDIPTPRGPDLSIRPRPEDILKWIDRKKFDIVKNPFILEPYHFGMLISKRH
jgi:ubiquinone/menaquinone biosynthesis C-methylase UbiE